MSSRLDDEKPDKKKKCGSGGNGGEPDQTSWRYHPVDVEWQCNACNVMGLHFHGPNTATPGGPDVVIKPPVPSLRTHPSSSASLPSSSDFMRLSRESIRFVRSLRCPLDFRSSLKSSSIEEPEAVDALQMPLSWDSQVNESNLETCPL